jgi:Undecaprenyl-phosphate galactose phosphotransferase WbaP
MSAAPQTVVPCEAAIPILRGRTGLLHPGAARAKRFVDVACGFAAALVALPLALAIAAAIALESRGPVFYRQTRIGRHGRRFQIWKFRTMVVNASEALRAHLDRNPADALEWLATHKLRNDPRVTRVGRLLRRTSLDELPQLWNVLRGEMSLVGPRPIVEEELPKYGAGFALYMQVRPGVTGLWQVSGRNDTTYHQRVELDGRYIRAWTPLVDLRVLLKTAPVALSGRGAY